MLLGSCYQRVLFSYDLTVNFLTHLVSFSTSENDVYVVDFPINSEVNFKDPQNGDKYELCVILYFAIKNSAEKKNTAGAIKIEKKSIFVSMSDSRVTAHV